MTTENKNAEASPLSASNGSEYRIEKVADFLKVPEDRLASCLEEFADFLQMSRDMLGITKSLADIIGVEDASKIGAYTWIDDGKKDKSIRMVPFQNTEHTNDYEK